MCTRVNLPVCSLFLANRYSNKLTFNGVMVDYPCKSGLRKTHQANPWSDSSPVSVVADLSSSVGGGDEEVHHPCLQLLSNQKTNHEESLLLISLMVRVFCSYLTHLCDRVIKDASRVVGPLAHQLHLPSPGRQSEVGGVQLHDLPSDLHKDGLTLPAPEEQQHRTSVSLTQTNTHTQVFRSDCETLILSSTDLVAILLTVIWGP